MRRRTIAALAAAATLALVATGCSAGGATDDAPSSLVYATGEPDHLTPGRQTVAFDQVMSVFAPLTQTDADGDLQDVAAKSVESDDATTWTITLRDGWTFQNGEAVTPESYVKAWNHVAYGPNAWENSGQLAGIVGYTDLNPAKGTPKTKEMSGLEVTGKDTFTVTLTHADSQFPLQLSQAQTAFYPMPEAAYDDLKAYDRKPIGNGPYEMTKAWKADQEFTVTAWKDYEGTKPATDEVTFRSYSDMNTAYTDVLAGNADVLFLPTDKMTSAKADFGDRLHSFDAPGIDYLGFPLWDDRYSDPDVRRAISMSIDRDEVNDAIYGGLYDPATALTPPSMSGTEEGICGDACEFDPAAAKKLLASAGGFDGTMTLVYPGGTGLDSLYEAYANQIRQNLGVDAEAKATTDWASYYSGSPTRPSPVRTSATGARCTSASRTRSARCSPRPAAAPRAPATTSPTTSTRCSRRPTPPGPRTRRTGTTRRRRRPCWRTSRSSRPSSTSTRTSRATRSRSCRRWRAVRSSRRSP
nr:ABC transporter substrate-binding protein [Curtobacterium flaccumfaciens]